VKLEPNQVTLSQLRQLWAGDEGRLDEASLQRVAVAAASIDRIVAGGETVYGVNTGFGLLANTRIHDDRLAELQTNLILSHSAGLGDPLPRHVSRLMIVDSLPFFGMLFGPTATVAMVEPQGKAMRDQMAAAYGKPADAAGAEATANRLALKPESRAKVKAWAMAADPRVSGEAMYEDLTTDLRPDLAGIKTPITLVYPWAETGPTKAMADALYRGAYAAAPNVTFVDVGDSAHFVMLDQPEVFGAALKRFADAK